MKEARTQEKITFFHHTMLIIREMALPGASSSSPGGLHLWLVLGPGPRLHQVLCLGPLMMSKSGWGWELRVLGCGGSEGAWGMVREGGGRQPLPVLTALCWPPRTVPFYAWGLATTQTHQVPKRNQKIIHNPIASHIKQRNNSKIQMNLHQLQRN